VRLHLLRRCCQKGQYLGLVGTLLKPTMGLPLCQHGPFCKWGIDFMTCNPASSNGHMYIIRAVYYFTKWVKSMPTFNNISDKTTHFFFNHVITRFRIPLQLVFDHNKHFQNEIFANISSKLVFSYDFSSPYYPHSNQKVEVVNKVLKTMLQRTVNKHKINWHHMLFSSLWAYRTVVKTATSFTLFHLFHGIEATLPIECKIPMLCTAIEIFPDIAPM
jgi:hypothetical protein